MRSTALPELSWIRMSTASTTDFAAQFLIPTSRTLNHPADDSESFFNFFKKISGFNFPLILTAYNKAINQNEPKIKF